MNEFQMSEIVNNREEAISRLQDKLFIAECDRDSALERVGDLTKALGWIQSSESLEGAKAVAGEALKEKE